MDAVDVTAWVKALEDSGEGLAVAAEAAGPGAEVPSCPDWRVRDLVLHLSGVHRWATMVVATASKEPGKPEQAHEIADSLPDDAGLVPWFREGLAALVAALRAAPADLECWTFLRARTPLEHWARRQAHETAMHRVDAEAAGGTRSPIEAAFAADGVDELLTCFAPRSRKTRWETPHALGVHATDTGDRWTMRLSDERAVVTREAPPEPADTVLRGTAEQLYLALWNRAPLPPLQAAGDGALVEALPAMLRVRW